MLFFPDRIIYTYVQLENEALFLKDEEGYKLVWDDSMIFPNLTSTDKVRVSTTQAERGEILDRNGRVLAGKGTASSVGIVPGELENREEAIAQVCNFYSGRYGRTSYIDYLHDRRCERKRRKRICC